MKPNYRKVLICLVNEFLSKNKPIGSKTLCENYDIFLSPASVRNILRDLESMGYLISKHISGGRIPTVLSYRLYIDSLNFIDDLTIEEKQKIQLEYLKKIPTLDNILACTSKILSSISNQAGFIIGFKNSVETIKHIELIHTKDQEILMIVVMRSGNVLNKTIFIEKNCYQYQLYEVSKFLNQRITGYTLKDSIKEVFPKIKKENSFNTTLNFILEAVEKNINLENDETNVYVDGRENFFKQLYNDNEKKVLERIFKLLDNKLTLKEIFYKYYELSGCYSILGDEDDNIIDGISIISSSYQIGDQKVGSLGIIGPQRMNYNKNFPLVEFTSNLVSEILTKISN